MATLKTDSLDGVITVTIDRPEKRNALSREVLAELAETFTAAENEGLKAAVITGAGGVITDWQGSPLTLRSADRFIAAGDARVHDQALAILDGATR